MTGVRRLVALGGSWGGITATRVILRDLHLPDDAALVMVLHRQPVRSALADVLGRASAYPVQEAEDKTALRPGRVYVAPPDYHLLIEPAWLALSTEEPVRFSRPSIDVLLESAADTFAHRLVAVVLTGASDDGTAGARAVHRRGGTVIVQDPTSAEQPLMPRSVIEAGLAHQVVDLDDLAGVIGAAVRGRSGGAA